MWTLRRRITMITAALALAAAAAAWLLAGGHEPAAKDGERGGASGGVPIPVAGGTLAGAPGARAPTGRGPGPEAEGASAAEPARKPCTIHLRGRVLDPSGAVPADAWVFAAAYDGGFENRWWVLARATVARDGAYAIDFAAPEVLRLTSVGRAAPGRETVRTLVDLPACADGASDRVLEMDFAFPVEKRIRGRVADADGRGMPGFAFLWYGARGVDRPSAPADPRADAQTWLDQGAAPLVVTDRDGRFEVEGDPEKSPSPSPASLDAGWILDRVESITRSGAAGSESDEIRVVARPAGGIDFRIVAGGAEAPPLAEAAVVAVASCDGKGLSEGEWTVEEGRARVVFAWPDDAQGPAEVEFLVEALGCAPHRGTVSCRRGEGVKRVDVRLDPAATPRRAVTVREKEVVALCLRYQCDIRRIVSLGDARIGRPVSQHAVSESGLDIALAPGKHEVEFHPSLPFAEHVPWVLTIDVPEEGEARTSVVRPTYGSVRIVDPDLQPGWNRPASLSLRDAAGGWVPGGYGHTVTLRAGGTVLPYFPVGDWTLVETYDSGFSREYSVHVTAGAETVVTLRHR